MTPKLVEPCEVLVWDTSFFGFRIAHVKADILTPETAASIDAWCLRQEIQCLYFFSRADDSQTTALAESHGYSLVDIRMTFHCRPTQVAKETSGAVRSACADDLARLTFLARANSADSRFSFDKRFPAVAGAQLYERWMEASCQGKADATFVSGETGAPVGYITCEVDPAKRLGKIGLLGIAAEARSRGLGMTLVRHALNWFHSNGCEQINVVTQGRNIAAQRLYQRAGFLTKEVRLSYHKWYSSRG